MGSLIKKQEAINADYSPINLEGVGGYKRQIAKINELVNLQFNDPELLRTMKASARGILLYGPPGAGKALIAHEIANKHSALFVHLTVTGLFADSFEKISTKLKASFDYCEQREPSLLFIEDLDIICVKQPELEVAREIKALMKALKTESKMVVIASASSNVTVDLGLRGIGLCDHQIEIGYPNAMERHDILQILTKDLQLDFEVDDLKEIADCTQGYVGADLASLCSKVSIEQIRLATKVMDLSDLNFSPPTITMETFQTVMSEFVPALLSEVPIMKTSVKWEEIYGLDDAAEQLQLTVNHPNVASRGVLIVGPTGCGKSMLVNALAFESQAVFIKVDMQKLHGNKEAKTLIQNYFAKAKILETCVLFFDNINRAPSEVINLIIAEMDAIPLKSNIRIIAACNDVVDKALILPGRFDSFISVHLPDDQARVQILESHIFNYSVAIGPAINFDQYSRATEGFTGADIILLCQRACRFAVKENPSSPELTEAHIDEALQITFHSVISEDLYKLKEFGIYNL